MFWKKKKQPGSVPEMTLEQLLQLAHTTKNGGMLAGELLDDDGDIVWSFTILTHRMGKAKVAQKTRAIKAIVAGHKK